MIVEVSKKENFGFYDSYESLPDEEDANTAADVVVVVSAAVVDSLRNADTVSVQEMEHTSENEEPAQDYKNR